MISGEKIIEESVLDQKGNPVDIALGMFEPMNPSELLNIVNTQYDKAADALAEKKPVLFFLPEHTHAGGRYAAQALLDPVANTALIEMPEGNLQKGRLPGVIHAVRSVPVAARLSEAKARVIFAHDSNPALQFVSQEQFSDAAHALKKEATVAIIPLVAAPDHADVFEFHSQARGIDPETIARGYYELIQADPRVAEHKLRYAMFVFGNSPSHKREIHISVSPVDEVKKLYKSLLPMERIKKWQDLSADKNITIMQKQS